MAAVCRCCDALMIPLLELAVESAAHITEVPSRNSCQYQQPSTDGGQRVRGGVGLGWLQWGVCAVCAVCAAWAVWAVWAVGV